MRITIIGATYGSLIAGLDVTEVVQKIVNTGNDDILVTNKTMGGDPEPGVTKVFGVLYKLPDGSILARGCLEYQTVDLVQ